MLEAGLSLQNQAAWDVYIACFIFSTGTPIKFRALDNIQRARCVCELCLARLMTERVKSMWQQPAPLAMQSSCTSWLMMFVVQVHKLINI